MFYTLTSVIPYPLVFVFLFVMAGILFFLCRFLGRRSTLYIPQTLLFVLFILFAWGVVIPLPHHKVYLHLFKVMWYTEVPVRVTVTDAALLDGQEVAGRVDLYAWKKEISDVFLQTNVSYFSTCDQEEKKSFSLIAPALSGRAETSFLDDIDSRNGPLYLRARIYEGGDSGSKRLLGQSACTLIEHNLVSMGGNLVKGADGRNVDVYWTRQGDAAVVEREPRPDFMFEVRDKGDFFQDVTLPAGARFAMLISKASYERMLPEDVITDKPYLYGYMMRRGSENDIDDYLQGERMRGYIPVPGIWTILAGLFEIPETSDRIRLFLGQASRNGVPNDGSAAWFYRPRIYAFDKEGDVDILKRILF